MKRAVSLALLAIAALAADQNAVQNGGFESGMELWDTAGGPVGIAIDSAVAHGGKQSVRLFGATSGVHQFIGFTGNFQHPIRVSAWSRTQDVKAEAFAIWVTGEYADGTKIERDGEDFDSGTHDWQRVEFIFDPRKPVKSLELLAVLVNGTGTAWLDDVSFSNAIIGALAEQGDIFSHVCGFSGEIFDAGLPGFTGRVQGAWVTGDYCDLNHNFAANKP